MNSKRMLLVWGLLAGAVAAALAYFGNPGNMAICIACFIRDIAGSLGLHQAAVVQYFRPEIVGLIVGAMIMALVSKEFRSSGGSSPGIRFIMGMLMMIGALVFLGCPTRMVFRIAAGDISAMIGLIGFVAGIYVGVIFLKKGFSLGRSHETKAIGGWAFPVFITFLFILSLVLGGLFLASESGPGSMHTPIIISLLGGLIFGAIAQKSRMCFGGAFRDLFLLKDYSLFAIVFGIFIVMLGYNLITNNFAFVAYGPIAHAEAIWNILGLFVVGFSAVLLGGCPLRQLILTGQGSSDAAFTVTGMLLGAALAHNFTLASAPASPEAVGGPNIYGQGAIILSIIVLFIIAFVGIRRKKA